MTVLGNSVWISSAKLSGSPLIEYLEYSVVNKFVYHGTCRLCVLPVFRSNYKRCIKIALNVGYNVGLFV